MRLKSLKNCSCIRLKAVFLVVLLFAAAGLVVSFFYPLQVCSLEY